MSLGVGIIGTGQIALANHLAGIRLVPEARLMALADSNPAALQNALTVAGLPPAAGSTDYLALLRRDDVHAVVIATPNFTHAEIALAAIGAGKHVLCEKPLALNLEQAETMYHAAAARGVRHMTAFTYRFVPAMRYMRHLVAAGYVGVPRHFRANRFQDWGTRGLGWRQVARLAGTGELGDMLSHRIDYAHQLVGPTVRLIANTRNYLPERGGALSDVDDYVALLTEQGRGVTGVLESSKMCSGRGEGKNSQDLCEVNGSEGSLVYSLSTPHQLLGAKQGAAGLQPIEVPRAFRVWPGSARDPDAGDALVTFRYDQDVEFLRAILDGRPCEPGFREGAAVQAVMDTAVRSALEQRWLEVPLPAEFTAAAAGISAAQGEGI